MNEMVINNTGAAMSVADATSQVQQIQQLMASVMKVGEHFGTIPGCGNKPTLLQPGAQKLALMFGFAPKYEIDKTCYGDMGDGHREYEVTCEIVSRTTGDLIGQGVGVCSTMEGKFRYRSENTGSAVPSDYWDTKDESILGGSDFHPRKVSGKWMVFHRVEHANPADYYNTVKKMAKKRAFVDAVLTATAASDIFTQDLEDMPEIFGPNEGLRTKERIVHEAKGEGQTTTENFEEVEQEAPKRPTVKGASRPTKPDQDEDLIHREIVVDRVNVKQQMDEEGEVVEGGWAMYLIYDTEGNQYKSWNKEDAEEAKRFAVKGTSVRIICKHTGEWNGTQQHDLTKEGWNTIPF